MGQKVNPISLRVGITRTWNSNWFVANKNTYKVFLHEDLKIRTFIKKGFFQSGISKIEIERSSNEKVRIIIFCSKPGLLIGRKGADIDLLRKFHPFQEGFYRKIIIPKYQRKLMMIIVVE